MGTPVPKELLDTATLLRGYLVQIDALNAERDSIADEFVSTMMTMHHEGRLEDLYLSLQAFKSVYGQGFSKRAKAAGIPEARELKRQLWGQCNDGEGRWKGDFPLADRANRPRPGTWVVYQLLIGDQLLYIGSTSSLASRLYARGREKTFDRWRAAQYPDEVSCRALEAALIDRYRPPLNRMIARPKVALT